MLRLMKGTVYGENSEKRTDTGRSPVSFCNNFFGYSDSETIFGRGQPIVGESSFNLRFGLHKLDFVKLRTKNETIYHGKTTIVQRNVSEKCDSMRNIFDCTHKMCAHVEIQRIKLVFHMRSIVKLSLKALSAHV